jgi:hypothetical protein
MVTGRSQRLDRVISTQNFRTDTPARDTTGCEGDCVKIFVEYGAEALKYED